MQQRTRDFHADMQTLATIQGLAEKRDFDRAAALAEKTLASGFEHPLLFNVIAAWLEHQGRFNDALGLLERAVAMAPADVGARNGLALCLQRLDRPAEALFHLNELLKKHPDLGFAHASKGNALIALGSPVLARESHLRALELEPGNVAAMAALASIGARRGEYDEARQWAARALAASPGLPSAVISLATAELAAGALDRAEQLLHQLIIGSRADPSDRARATGLLGDVLDAAGRYDEAFEAYATCNEALRQRHRRFATEPGALAQVRALGAALETIAPGAWPASPRPAVPGVGHVFLLGFPRSGTIPLEAIFNGHPQIVSIARPELLPDAWDLEALQRADESQLDTWRAAYFDGVHRSGADLKGKVLVDKHSLNTLRLPLISRLFPGAKILFAHRDPRDAVLNNFRHRSKMSPAMYELLTLTGGAAFYDAVMTVAERARPITGLQWRVVRHEDLATDLPKEARAIMEFIDVEWTAGLDDIVGIAKARGGKGPDVGHWRHYSVQLEEIQPLLDPWVERLGYSA
jgi:tetratricopeptide (TPR) repeat protein